MRGVGSDKFAPPMALRAKTQQVTRPVHGLSPMARAHAEGQGLPDFCGIGEDALKTANVFTVSCYAARAQYRAHITLFSV